MDELSQKLRELVVPVLQDEQLELVALEIKGTAGSRVIRFVVDSDRGVTLDACASVSRRLSGVLDADDIIPDRYRLEVSSPGVGRPLSSLRDYQRNLNRDIELKCDDDGNERTVSGKLTAATEDGIGIEFEKNLEVIPWSKIRHGKLRLPW